MVLAIRELGILLYNRHVDGVSHSHNISDCGHKAYLAFTQPRFSESLSKAIEAEI